MGAFSDIFGKVPRVLILETLAENFDEELTARDIIDETDVSKRGVYLILKKFIKEGIVVKIGEKPTKYRLNQNDLRARTLIRSEPLLITGKLEYELKVDDNIPLDVPYFVQSTKIYQNYDFPPTPSESLINENTEFQPHSTFNLIVESTNILPESNKIFPEPSGA